MSKRFRPEVGCHLHGDVEVTVKRVQAFVEAPFDVQLEVRAELRRRIADDTSSMQLGLYGLAIALVIGVSAAPHVRPVDGLPWWAAGIATTVVGVLLGFAVLPVAFFVLPGHGRRVRAAVWLGAFDDVQHSSAMSSKAASAPRTRRRRRSTDER